MPAGAPGQTPGAFCPGAVTHQGAGHPDLWPVRGSGGHNRGQVCIPPTQQQHKYNALEAPSLLGAESQSHSKCMRYEEALELNKGKGGWGYG